MTANVLRLIGLTRKAGRLEIGEEPVGSACRARSARVVLLASDAAENTVSRADKFAREADIPCVSVPFTKEELGRCVGRTSAAMLALTDPGLAAGLMSKLAALDPERYGETAQRLTDEAERFERRRKQARAEARAAQKRSRRPWVAPPKQSKSGGKKK